MSTVNIKINGYDYTMKKGITILDASFETLKMQREFMQQSIPTLYYLKGVQDVDPVSYTHLNWFPRKKGIALGWATMGAPISSSAFVAGFAVLLATKGIRTAFVIFGVLAVIVGIVTFFWAKNEPADVNCLPDNMEPVSYTHLDVYKRQEWVDLTNMRGIVKQALPTKGAFGDPEFRNTQGDYFAVEIEVPGMDSFNASLLHVDYDKYEEFDQYIQEHEVEVKPLLFQDEDMKVVAWELVEDNGFKKIPEIKAPEPKKEETKTATATAAVDLSNDATTQTVIEAAADAYGVDVASITLATDIREDLSNESMKMIVMISTIEDQLLSLIHI